MSRATFSPLGPRIVLFLLWTLVASPVVYAATAVPGPAWISGGLSAMSAVAIVYTGVLRARRLSLAVDSEGLSVRNFFGDYAYSWSEIASVTLRRFASRRSVEQEGISSLPRLLTVYGIRFPGVAVRLRDGNLSPPSSVTLLTGPRTRTQLLEAVEHHARANNVPVVIRESNRGWLFGLSWDITRR